MRTFITVTVDLPLLGLLLQRLVHLTTRSKLKDEIDPRRKSCKLRGKCELQPNWPGLVIEVAEQPENVWMPQMRLDLNLPSQLVLHLTISVWKIINFHQSHFSIFSLFHYFARTWAFWSWDLKRTLSATMYLLFFSRARYTFPNLPFPNGRLNFCYAVK